MYVQGTILTHNGFENDGGYYNTLILMIACEKLE